ncbi:hypothetical protein BCD49_25400 [Pseudofrankia sp. EUN1h]|nr:hypothetical protein BCD49_25400 [Pseudofrankia sp. EUN1h]
MLAAARATAALDRAHPAHPDLTFLSLYAVVGAWDQQAREIFRVGTALAMARCGQLGLHRMLPPDRVWVGIRSESAERYGGFHHGGQGYRHLQMGAVVTQHGYLHPSQPGTPPTLVALDLLRSYTHDSLHYGTFREYVIYEAEVFRTRYGINRRDPGGLSFSAVDPPDAESTRNLGVVMEGATDREARTVARHTAVALGLSAPADASNRVMFHDTTGQLTGAERAKLASCLYSAETYGCGIDRYLAALAAYNREVDTRYTAFLAEIGGREAEDLHVLIVAAMVTGDLGELTRWLDQRHGADAFDRIFRRSG